MCRALARLPSYSKGAHHCGWALSIVMYRLYVIVDEALGLDVGVHRVDAVKPALLVPVANEDCRGVFGQGEVRAQTVAVDVARPHMHLHTHITYQAEREISHKTDIFEVQKIHSCSGTCWLVCILSSFLLFLSYEQLPPAGNGSAEDSVGRGEPEKRAETPTHPKTRTLPSLIPQRDLNIQPANAGNHGSIQASAREPCQQGETRKSPVKMIMMSRDLRGEAFSIGRGRDKGLGEVGCTSAGRDGFAHVNCCSCVTKLQYKPVCTL